MAIVIVSSAELSAQPLSSYHPTQLQKTLQYVPAFQKDRLEAVPPSCTLCNIIRRHLFTITMGIYLAVIPHESTQHTPPYKTMNMCYWEEFIVIIIHFLLHLVCNTRASRTIIKGLPITTYGLI